MHRRTLLVAGTTGLLLRHMQARAQSGSPEPASPYDAVLQAALDHGLIGIAAQITRQGEPLFEAAIGLASREAQTPLAITDQFRIYSVTKTFTALLVLQLVDEGTLTLDAPITTWLHNPAADRIPNIDQVTSRQLLTHTSGIYDYFAEDSPFWQDAYLGEDADWTHVWAPDDLLAYAALGEHDPDFPPGMGVHYSNTGYILLGLLIEAVTGQPYATVLQERILDPLGMNATVYAATEPMPAGVVPGYHLFGQDLVDVSSTHLSAQGAEGGIVSTTADLTRLAQALADGSLLSAETRKAMTIVIPSERPGLSWGMGVAIMQSPSGDLLGMGGSGPGYAARMFLLPAQDLTVVVLTNTNQDDAFLDQVLEQLVEIAVAQP